MCFKKKIENKNPNGHFFVWTLYYIFSFFLFPIQTHPSSTRPFSPTFVQYGTHRPHQQWAPRRVLNLGAQARNDVKIPGSPVGLPSLKLTASLPLKNGGWKTFAFPFEMAHFQVRTVSFREGSWWIFRKSQRTLTQDMSFDTFFFGDHT